MSAERLMIGVYRERYKKLFSVCLTLHELDELELERLVIKIVAGLDMLIKHCESVIATQKEIAP